jgi:hypothetical protein
MESRVFAKHRQCWLRMTMVIVFAPGLLALIMMMVVLRPLTAYEDGFHGPDGMWQDVLAWVRSGELRFPNWQRATRGHLPHRHASSQPRFDSD